MVSYILYIFAFYFSCLGHGVVKYMQRVVIKKYFSKTRIL